MKLISPVPDEIQLKLNLTPMSAAFARCVPPGFCPPITSKLLMACEQRGREYLARIKTWSHEAHGVDYERIVADYKRIPSAENQEAMRKAGSRADHSVEYSRMRNTLTKGLSEFVTRDMLPVALPVLSQALDAVEERIAEFEQYEEEIYKSYRVPREMQLDDTGRIRTAVPHVIVRELSRLVAGQRDLISLAQKDVSSSIGFWQGDVLPSRILREFIYIDVEE